MERALGWSGSGTNIWTAAGTQQGTPFNVTLPPRGINIPNMIRVYITTGSRPAGRDLSRPTVPTTVRAAPPATRPAMRACKTWAGQARGRLYITNSGYNRIEVFDTQQQKFLNPIPGQMPHQMAMGTDGNTLYVATRRRIHRHRGPERATGDGGVIFPPVPRSGTSNGSTRARWPWGWWASSSSCRTARSGRWWGMPRCRGRRTRWRR